MALKVLSNITVPPPRYDDTENDISYVTDAATRGYVDGHSGGGSASAATTNSAGTVTLASNTGNNSDEGKVPVLDNEGKLNSNVLPATVVKSNMIYPHSALWLHSIAPASSVIDCEHSVSGSYLSKNGWYIYISSARSPDTLIFEPSMGTLDSSTCYTYELIISCGGNKGNSFDIKIVDEDNEDVLFLGDSITSLERGYTYFLVARYFRTMTSSNTYTWQWVFNLQGRVPIPSSSS